MHRWCEGWLSLWQIIKCESEICRDKLFIDETRWYSVVVVWRVYNITGQMLSISEIFVLNHEVTWCGDGNITGAWVAFITIWILEYFVEKYESRYVWSVAVSQWDSVFGRNRSRNYNIASFPSWLLPLDRLTSYLRVTTGYCTADPKTRGCHFRSSVETVVVTKT